MKRLLWMIAPAVVAGLCVVPALPSSASTGQAEACSYPADVLALTNWKQTLPTGSSSKPTEITQPKLATYSVDPWFKAASGCGGVQFRAAVNGVTTSNSGYPRSELREMTNGGAGLASWSTTSGTHTMIVDQTITQLPSGKPEIIAGQIHDSSSDLTAFRLKGTSLYISKGNDSTYQLVTSSYQLGTKFEAKFVAGGGKVKVYYNGALKATVSSSSSSNFFKAGAYTQANCTNASPCSSSNYGEVVIHNLSVTHK
ncbi:polysaccharide lyase family 7 protein [Amycolatopsis sp.]|jgi:hypothetical protein|uniref:polysaccharide lyase family 7 protein n=1 Tax=Amycolatopsis sp. TaxID=37632 RepID=UPI002DFA84F1|nr:polysaccharide lyase family 7 protein [Amycolatopsis sp.]